MNKLVLDCSVYMSWCLDEESIENSTKILKSIFKSEILVPSIWAYEVTNAFFSSVKRNRLSVAEAHKLIHDIQLLPISFDKPLIEDMANIFNIANEHKLSAYDAAYIELALRANAPLASFDNDIIKTANKLGIRIFHGSI